VRCACPPAGRVAEPQLPVAGGCHARSTGPDRTGREPALPAPSPSSATAARGRRDFLRAAGLGGAALALAACGSGGVESALVAPGAPRAPTDAVVGADGSVTLDFNLDTDVLNYAYALEQLEAAFYIAVTSAAGFSATFAANEQRILVDLRDHEIVQPRLPARRPRRGGDPEPHARLLGRELRQPHQRAHHRPDVRGPRRRCLQRGRQVPAQRRAALARRQDRLGRGAARGGHPRRAQRQRSAAFAPHAFDPRPPPRAGGRVQAADPSSCRTHHRHQA
jgi:hypothetical protein